MQKDFLLLILLLSRCVDVRGKDELSTSNLRRISREVKDECNLTITVHGYGGTLTSPNYPDKYPSNTDCRWLLEAADPNATIFLRIDSLQLEPDTNCKLDYLQVHLGSSTLSPALDPICGHVNDRVVKTNSSTILLVFHSDPVYEEKGFLVDYFTQNAGDCKTSLTDDSGVIRSPGFPNNYPDQTDCWTLISVRNPSKKIVLQFDLLDFEYGENCTFDYVQVYDGATRDSPLLGQVCSRHDDSKFESTANSLLVHFHSDESVNRKGYRAKYNAMDKRILVSGDCLWEREEGNGTIASPNYPAHYPSSSNCSIWLQAPENQNIQIQFEALQLEMEANCTYDFLQLLDGPPPGSKSMGVFCGRKSEPRELTSTSPEVQVVFLSDDFAEFSGFKLRYWFQKNETETSLEKAAAAPAVAKSSFDSVPENATLDIGASHMLKCSSRNPLARIRWLKGDHFLAGGSPMPGLKLLSNNSLWIKSMDYSLAGQYTCVMVTAQETVSVNAYIRVGNSARVNDSACGIVFRKTPRDSSFAEGEFAHLECLAGGGHVQLSWEKEGTPLVSDLHLTLKNGYIFLDKVRLADAGVYTCIAYDEVADCTRRASAFLQVSERAKIEEICGKPKVGKPSTDVPLMEHGKIVGGHNTKKGAYPWQVMLWEPTLKSFCGGSLLNERWIATAAHCFRNYQGLRWDRIVIKVGKHDREREEAEEFRTGIADLSSIVVHPAYNKVNFDNDLALVKLRDHVRFSSAVLPVCLPDDRTLGEELLDTTSRGTSQLRMGTVTGWGKLKEFGPSPRFLQEISLPVVEQKTCMASTNYTVSRNMFCAGYAQEILGDACHGDSGGPFLMPHNDRWYLIGIVSWGEGCGKANKYGFYTRIPNYLLWIKGTIKS